MGPLAVRHGARPRPRKIALVTHGFETGGGVATVAGWLHESLTSVGGYTVDIHDLATSSRDRASRRIAAPRSWARLSLLGPLGGTTVGSHWGANAVEFEAMRYRPRRELNRALCAYDIIQVVAGAPAWASVVVGAGVPVVLQVATTVACERRWQLAEQTGALRVWRETMTHVTSRVERRVLKSVDVVLVENAVMLEYVRKAGQTSVVKAPPGVDTTLFSPPIDGWHRRGYLLSVCRFADARKGLERLIRAYAHMLRMDESIPVLVLAGRGQPPEPLLTLMNDLSLSSRITVRANVSVAELPVVYRGASVFIQTSYEEGLGMSVLEAMSCGLPVVCTDTAGTRETVVDGVTGWRVRQDDGSQVPSLVGDRVLEVLNGDGAAFGVRARERCTQLFSTSVGIRRFTDVYDAVLGR